MAPRKCAYFGCNNSSSDYSMFRFPINDKKRMELWLARAGNMALGHLNEIELSNRYICEAHFEDYDIKMNTGFRPVLEKTAIPKHKVEPMESLPGLKVKTPIKVYKGKRTMELEKNNLQPVDLEFGFQTPIKPKWRRISLDESPKHSEQTHIQETGGGEGPPASAPDPKAPSDLFGVADVKMEMIEIKEEPIGGTTSPAESQCDMNVLDPLTGPAGAAADLLQDKANAADSLGVAVKMEPVEETTAPAETQYEMKVLNPSNGPSGAAAELHQDKPQAGGSLGVAVKMEPIEDTTAPAETQYEKKVLDPSNGPSSAPAELHQDKSQAGGSGDWQKREMELLKRIQELEKVKSDRSDDALQLALKLREDEIELLKARVAGLEAELRAALGRPEPARGQELVDRIKLQHDELLTKARGMIFDKTKMVKNQELQIEALTTQVHSLKDINQITKDLLAIRNAEVQAMQERLDAMEGRIKGEKERYELVLKRAQTSSGINDDLRKEYETQLAIFKELREKYDQRVQALVAENNRLKESLQGGPSG